MQGDIAILGECNIPGRSYLSMATKGRKGKGTVNGRGLEIADSLVLIMK